MGMRTLEQIARQWELLGIPLCNFCEFPLYEEDVEFDSTLQHRCLADPDGCGCGEDCPIKEDKCGCHQCWGTDAK